MPLEITEQGTGQRGQVDRTFQRHYQRRFQLEFDPVDGDPPDAYSVILALNYALGTTFPTDPWAAVLNLDVECASDDGYTWFGTVDYGPYDPRITENPLDQPPELEWDAVQFERTADVDVETGLAVVNSAGDYFDPPVLRDDSRPVLRVSVNMADPLPPDLFLLKDKVNNAPFLGWDLHCAKCSPVRARQAFHPSVPGTGLYWAVTLEIQFHEETWDPKILDQGLRKLDATTTPPTQKQIVIDGSLATAPALLDGAGGVLENGADPVFLQFRVYPEADFSILGFS